MTGLLHQKVKYRSNQDKETTPVKLVNYINVVLKKIALQLHCYTHVAVMDNKHVMLLSITATCIAVACVKVVAQNYTVTRTDKHTQTGPDTYCEK